MNSKSYLGRSSRRLEFLKSLLIPGLILAVLLLFNGCSSVNVSADVAPNANLAELHTFYVVKAPDDDTGIDAMIADKLKTMGREAECGAAPKPAKDVDAVVTYVDRWMWDITMYMLELNVELTSGKDGTVIASGHSYRTSLARKKPEFMVGEVMDVIFNGNQKGSDKK